MCYNAPKVSTRNHLLTMADELKKPNETDKLNPPLVKAKTDNLNNTDARPEPTEKLSDEKKAGQTDNLSDPANTSASTSAPSSPTRRDPSRDTAILSSSGSRWRRAQNQTPPGGTTSLGDQREIIFVIRGMVERVILRDNFSIILGRAEPGSKGNVDIDLTPYGALDRGVSRIHARLHLENNRIFITDLDSTNGTFLSGRRLEPHKAEPLRKGDELLLGRLPVQVLFR